jgi:hypothetical protein
MGVRKYREGRKNLVPIGMVAVKDVRFDSTLQGMLDPSALDRIVPPIVLKK